ncbi:MAG: hypothetical protein M3Q07_25010, partial [Pseudobdellovibrionaceae bacterium]|nr:hypothetical protein [Pseudobdellovibrionaceae bacterium]
MVSEERAGAESGHQRNADFYSDLKKFPLKLKVPVEVKGVLYSELIVREPIADDLWNIPDDGKKFWGDWFTLGAKLCNVEIFVIRRLRAHDAYK